MDLTNTEIEIRERSMPQRIDLGLRFLVTRGVGIFTYALIGIVPAMILNGLLVFMLDPYQTWNTIYWPTTWVLIWYLCWVQSPIVLSPLVVYLGQVLFRQQVSWSYVFREVRQRQWRQWLVHGVYRMQFFWVGLALIGYYLQSSGWFYSAVTFGALTNTAFGMLRPYVEQIIYLEQLPLSAKTTGTGTIGRRSAILHSFDPGAVFFESMAIGILTLFFFYGGYCLVLWTYYWITFNTVTQNWFSWTLFSIALWNTHVVATVLRFLGYLDTRIRSEGWELELRIKREAQVVAGLGRNQAFVNGLP